MSELSPGREREVRCAKRREIHRLLLQRVTPAALAVAALAVAGHPWIALIATWAAAVAIFLEYDQRQTAITRRESGEADHWRDRADWLRSALLTLSSPVVVVDESGVPQVFNRAAEEILGVGATDHKPSEWADVYGTFYADQVTPYPAEKLPFYRALHGEAADEMDMFVRNPLQQGVWLSASARPLRDDSGALRGAVLVCHDVTERHRSEAEIRSLNADLENRVRERTASLTELAARLERESEDRARVAEALRQNQALLQQIIDHSTPVIYVKHLDGRYRLVNRRWETLFHISREQMQGRTDADLFPPETVLHLRENDMRVAQERRSIQFEEVVPSENQPRTYVSEKFPLIDADGRVYAICGISTDITERKEMEAELRRSEASLSAMIESTSDSVWSIDRNFRLLAMNTALRTAYEEVFGSPEGDGDLTLDRRAPRDFLAAFADLYKRVFAGERVSVEQRFDVRGKTRHYLISMSPIRVGDEITGATGFSRDITDLRHTEELARRNQAELTHVLRLGTMGEIASALAHEINQPLGAIANYANACVRWLDVGGGPSRDLRQGLELISAEALRAGAIIRRLRDLGRKAEGSVHALDVNSLVNRAAELVRPEVQLQGISMQLHTASDLPQIDADPIQVEQVLLNLILNGIESMQESHVKVLSIDTAQNDGHVEVSVRDTGIGLDPQVGDQVFEPFFTTKPKGLGMGLAISRRIIEAHGGQLSGAPNPDGSGSRFRFTLPIAP